MSEARSATRLRCTCCQIDVQAHCVPAFYKDALAAAGLVVSIDGGFSTPDWSPAAAIDVVHRGGVRSLPRRQGEREHLARRLNESVAETVAAHPTRFGGLALLPCRRWRTASPNWDETGTT